jgi:hypothetical protein
MKVGENQVSGFSDGCQENLDFSELSKYFLEINLLITGSEDIF